MRELLPHERDSCSRHYKNKWPWAEFDMIKARFNGFPIDILEKAWSRGHVICERNEESHLRSWRFCNLPVDEQGNIIDNTPEAMKFKEDYPKQATLG